MTVAELKNNLSRYLREVRLGRRFTVLSRDLPVAQLSPIDDAQRLLEVRPPLSGAIRLRDVPLPPPLSVAGDIVELLLEERGTR
ncbi:MAG: type II toxin-antitoxin system Phd/YefM family antitoxin [Actinobacteria bacterium]|nr:type II toxin-antitoxin system Phd/YefM family antitoxin [Actinomycetota bacterium]